MKADVESRLKAGWSAEQIAGRMRLERHPIRMSHETIYRFAYFKDGRDEQFYRHLPNTEYVVGHVVTAGKPVPYLRRTKPVLQA